MNKYLYISLILVTVVLTGCVTSHPSLQPQGQTYGAGTHFHAKNPNEVEDLFNIVSDHAVRVPQRDAFSLRWVTVVTAKDSRRSFERALCTITIQSGGSFTAGDYPCLTVKAHGGSRFGDRLFSFNDPKLGRQIVNLHSFDGGYLQCEGADRGRGYPLPTKGTSAYMVEWSTHDTIRRSMRHPPEGWLAKAIDRGIRYNDCEPATRQVLSRAKKEIRLLQKLEDERFQLPLKSEIKQLKMAQREADRRYREELSSQQ